MSTLLNIAEMLSGLGGIGGYPADTAIAVLLGLLWGLLLRLTLPSRWFALAIVGQTAVAVIVTGAAESALGYRDDPTILLDEFVAASILATLIEKHRSLAYNGLLIMIATTSFGLLDSWKILGISLAERLPAGLGIVGDDLVAAAYGLGVAWAAAHVVFKYAETSKD